MAFRLTNNLKFSSIFSCDAEKVDQRFTEACEKLNISKWRCTSTVRGALERLLDSADKRKKGPEDSRLVDVRGDGNCLFYCLLAPLLGFVPGPVDQVFCFVQMYFILI